MSAYFSPYTSLNASHALPDLILIFFFFAFHLI